MIGLGTSTKTIQSGTPKTQGDKPHCPHLGQMGMQGNEAADDLTKAADSITDTHHNDNVHVAFMHGSLLKN